jgi:hypothetical protein
MGISKGIEAERALTECQKSGQDVRVSESREADAGAGVMLVTKWAIPGAPAINTIEYLLS